MILVLIYALGVGSTSCGALGSGGEQEEVSQQGTTSLRGSTGNRSSSFLKWLPEGQPIDTETTFEVPELSLLPAEGQHRHATLDARTAVRLVVTFRVAESLALSEGGEELVEAGGVPFERSGSGSGR